MKLKKVTIECNIYVANLSRKKFRMRWRNLLFADYETFLLHSSGTFCNLIECLVTTKFCYAKQEDNSVLFCPVFQPPSQLRQPEKIVVHRNLVLYPTGSEDIALLQFPPVRVIPRLIKPICLQCNVIQVGELIANSTTRDKFWLRFYF